ncbi:tetratricopeptide repeat protein [Candidatus Parabeggiatoa sp. HSG14]|uniref:tetratricopeptide repeat protein n=1 Tax=Candidatus Parabeggiatoa sp. HSG14 TaxID=3055593 RepID=UPI0025A7AF76|nr:tetratricopeptide repeat protein [Thiotrichales bacterium HSG14]
MKELNIDFHSANKFFIHFDSRSSELLDFQITFEDKEQKAIKWYFETYATDYTTEVDDDEAQSVVDKLPVWGARLFEAVFGNHVARRLYEGFQQQGGLLTVSATHPAILSLPWELLYDPESTFLYNYKPYISIRRRLARTDKAKQPIVVAPKERLRVLFVISRPEDENFIDPRADAKAVLGALNEETLGRFELEFLRPPTLDNLTKRLECRAQYRKSPAVDVLHFDGHGVFMSGDGSEPVTYSYKQSAETKKADGDPRFMGYLLFEDKESKTHLVEASTLGDMLTQQNVGLVVLSACQSAMMGGDEAMSSVAARLIHAGMPAVLAMTYSVLVETTRRLFERFYESLAYGAGIGAALDDARRYLYSHPERGERQRLEGAITLKVYDWFLPALYQVGDDNPLLVEEIEEPADLEKPFASNLPELQEAGFVGRKRELWLIERAFVHGTRRLTLSGFGGQGKTYLAIEAGQWLCQTGMFEAVCFIDYASFQGVDAVGLAVSTLATVLDVSLIDVDATTTVLGQKPTLLILDNLETLFRQAQQPIPPVVEPVETTKISPLTELLDAAEIWSKTGKCRVLLTTRSPDFHHPAYPTQGSLKHQALSLTGLNTVDALDYFQRLLKLPPAPSVTRLPKRAVILDLFRQVEFHPLSIGLLGKQLKMYRPSKLGLRLEKFIAETPDDPLLASLNLSLDKIDEEAKQWLPRLGVFQGGALLGNLIAITEIPESELYTLFATLISVGLIQFEGLTSDVTYIRFHPTLAPALKTRLSAEELAQLLARHQERYYQLSGYLHSEDFKNPHQARAIVQRELPNLLYAVKGALAAKTDNAVEFVEKVNLFLDNFGLNRDRADLTQQAEQIGGYLAMYNKGQHLYSQGQYQAAVQVFNEILTSLGELPCYERCATLIRLGRCFAMQGQAEQAIDHYRQGLAVAEKLEQSKDVKRLKGALHTDLADVLSDKGDFEEARKAYEASLVLAKGLDDHRMVAVANGQLGTLALLQNNLQEAAERYREALVIFQRLNEPKSEAGFHHQLGMVYDEAQQWDAAEQAYRESARINEQQGNLAHAVRTWDCLATVNRMAGKFEAADAWYRKAIEGAKSVGDLVQVASSLGNLADLLQTNYPNRLPEAQQLAEEALAIMKTLDSSVSEIWQTYNILAEIAEQQNEPDKAAEYRRLSDEAKV